MKKDPFPSNEDDTSKDIELEDEEEDSGNMFKEQETEFSPGVWKTQSNDTDWSKIFRISFSASVKWTIVLICIGVIAIPLILLLFKRNANGDNDRENGGELHDERQVDSVDYILSLPYLPTPISKPYEDSLKSLCDATIWQPGLYLNCTNVLNLPGKPEGTGNPQGTFNVKNAMQTCVRWAIDAGMGFIIPRIAIRSKTNLEYFDEWADFSFLFDEDNLRQTMSKECPQLEMYDHNHKIDKKIVAERRSFTYYANGWYRYHVNTLLNKSGHDLGKNSVVIWENEPLFSWEFYKDGDNVHQALYNAIKFNPSILAVGKTVTSLLPSSYIGIHIRAEKDAEGFLGILNYNTQVQGFLRVYKKQYSNIKTIYVATGDQSIDERFRDEMSDLDAKIVTKWDLASSNNQLRNQLDQLRFDQLGIVDYEVLRSSTAFFGMSLSSYTFGIGYERGNGNLTKCNCHITGEIPSIFNCCF
jgi:hypothetical protein